MEDLTPMMQQYHQIKRANPGKLLFFRLGDFYELFFEDAVVASGALEITLTSRAKDKHGQAIPMCGVPHFSVDGYIARLIKQGYKVAICEQMEDPKKTKKLVRREVTRIITPGTVVEEFILEPRENNFLAALMANGDRLGLAFLDLSTGEFRATEFCGSDPWERFQYLIAQFEPRELLYPEMLKPRLDSPPLPQVLERIVKSPTEDWLFAGEYATRVLLDHFGTTTLAGFGLDGHEYAIGAAGALIHYVRDLEKSPLPHIGTLSYFQSTDFLRLDRATVANLELVRTMESARAGDPALRSSPTLLSVLDFTRTRMGARLLKSWILQPILDLSALNRRLDALADLKRSIVWQDQLANQIQAIHDVERILSKVTVGTANARDLLALKSSLMALPAVKQFMDHFTAERLSQLKEGLDPLTDVRDLLDRALAEDPPATLNEGGLIRRGYHAELDELHDLRRDGKSTIAAIEARERARTGIASLRVKYNRVFGYYIEVTKSNLRLVPQDYIRKQTVANAERYITEELKEYEERVLTAEERIGELEKELFLAVRQTVASHACRIQSTARSIAEIDVLRSLAEAATRYNYVRPVLDESDALIVRNGRHPIVEHQSHPFIPNDLTMNGSGDQLLIITGPNMGGKSVYLRQSALIVIMAQMGSFVPATEATIGLVDQIFTRVGASDDLARGCSTFMQEMVETANILNTSTPRSLLLLDEVGRGTATFDGLSIAWAVAEYLHNQETCRAKTLFATHYHELTKLSHVLPGVKNYCLAVRDSGKEILFLRKVIPGTIDRSYGIEVARLAGLPAVVLQRARDILKKLERKEIDLSGGARSKATAEVVEEMQRRLF